MMHSSHEDIELCSIELYTKKKKLTKNSQKFGHGSPCQNRISSTEFGSVRKFIKVR